MKEVTPRKKRLFTYSWLFVFLKGRCYILLSPDVVVFSGERRGKISRKPVESVGERNSECKL